MLKLRFPRLWLKASRRERSIDPDAQLQAGDRARDAQRWHEASVCYARFLEQDPSNVAIWVQFGNCAKEAGDFKRALEAYDNALAISDSVADVHLQRGHLLKIIGRKDEAVSSYLRSFEIAPKGNPAFQELLALAPTSLRGLATFEADLAEHDETVTYVDVTDLIEYLKNNSSLSGIQRVVSSIIMYSIDLTKGCSAQDRIRAVLPDYGRSIISVVKENMLEQMLWMVAEWHVSRDILDLAIESVLNSRVPVRLRPGDTLLIAGAFWIYPSYDLLNDLRRKGVRISVFVHDLIQITGTEYVAPGHTTIFRRSFADIVCVSSYLFTNSDFVANDVRRYLTERLNFQVPVVSVKLATELGVRTGRLGEIDPEYIELAKEEYALCVGTIEIRKNHPYLIRIWESLIEKFDGTIPNLIFVGKWGWEIDELQELLSGSDYLGGRLYIFNSISDANLAFLYQNCLFTIYPSFAEGWGLPVGESLGYGKPCVASNATAIPEVGGSLCKYIDPGDVADGYRVVSGILSDRRGLAAWTARIRREFKPKSWNDFCSELFGVIQRYGQDHSFDSRSNNCIIEAGEIAFFGDDALALLDKKKRRLITARMCRVSGWHALEAWGCWAAKRKAKLRISTRILPNTRVIVYFNLQTPNGNECADCTIEINDTNTFVDGLGTVPRWCTAPGIVSEGGIIDITLISGSGFFHAGDRELYVGILALAVVPSDDTAAQIKLLNQIVPGGVPTSAQMANCPAEDRDVAPCLGGAAVFAAGQSDGS